MDHFIFAFLSYQCANCVYSASAPLGCVVAGDGLLEWGYAPASSIFTSWAFSRFPTLLFLSRYLFNVVALCWDITDEGFWWRWFIWLCLSRDAFHSPYGKYLVMIL